MKLVALDIDGTLVRHGETTPSPATGAAIAELQALGVAVVLASGRMFPGTVAIARHLRLETPLICQQGCAIHTHDGEMLHCFPIDRGAALDIVAYARRIDRPYEWFNPVRYVVSRSTPEALEYGRVSGITPEFRPDPELSGIDPTGVGIISSHEEASAVHRALAELHGDRLHLLDFPSVTVAVAPEANKGHALSLLCTDLDIDRSDVVAVGDSVNDAPMLAWAGQGFAMAQADRYALDACDEVLPDEPDALATLLEALVRAGRSGRRMR